MKRWKSALFSRTFQYPVLAMVVLVAMSVWYYRVAIRRSEADVNERSLRVLAALAEEFSSRVATLDQITQGEWESNALRGQVPELEEDECPPLKEVPSTKLSDAGYKLQLVVGGVQDPNKRDKGWLHSCWSISYQGLMGSLDDSLPKGVFEDVLIADATGRVLYQTHRSGMKVADLHPFFEGTLPHSDKPKHSSDEEPPVAGKDGKNPDQKHPEAGKQKHEAVSKEGRLSTRLAMSRLTDVDLGGEQYKLYTVPVPVPVLWNGSDPLTFIVGGILHERTFQAERTNPLLNTLVTIGFFVLLGAVGAYPILRFRLMGPTEVLKRRTGFVFLLQVVFTAILLGGLMGHLIFSHSNEKTNLELTRLANAVEGNLADETASALHMLDQIEQFYDKNHPSPGGSQVAGTCLDHVDDQKLQQLKLPPDDFHWTKEILNDIDKPVYPYFDSAFFADRAGAQEVKFSAKSSVTPAVRVCDSDAFSHAVRRNDLLWRFQAPDKGPNFWMEPMYSKTSGRYLAFISRASLGKLKDKAPVAVIGTAVVSVSEPVFPPDYGFAIVDREGEVLFHSTPAKNRRENFADACGRNRRLSDLFETRESDILDSSYLGIRHRILVRPITKFEDCPWSIVVFRDLTNWEEDHFDSVLMFCFLTGAYVLLAILLACWAGFTRAPARWIWPAKSDRRVYWRLFLVLIVVTLLNFFLFRQCDGTELWVSAYTIPLFAVIFTVLKLKFQDRMIVFLSVASCLIAGGWCWHHDASVLFRLECVGIFAAFGCLALPSTIERTLLLFAARKVSFGSRSIRRRILKTCHPSLATVYALPAIVLLFTIGFLPALRLFNASVLFQEVVAARRSEVELAERMQQRWERIKDAYAESAAGVLEQRRHDARDLYYPYGQSPFPEGGNDVREQQLEPLLAPIDSKFLKYIHSGSTPKHGSGLPGPNSERKWCEDDGVFPHATLMLKVAKPEVPCSDLKAQLAGDYGDRWIVSALPQQIPFNSPSADLFVFFELLTLIVMLIAGFFGLQYAIRRLFVLDWKRPIPWPAAQISPALDFRDKPFGRQTILLGLPRSSKTEELKRCANIHYIDLIDYSQGRTEDSFGLDDVVVLDHFEHDLDNSLQRGRKLRVMEFLVFEVKCRLVIATNIDPQYYFGQLAKRSGSSDHDGDDSLDIERWTKVLAGFQVVRAGNRSLIEGEQYFALLWQTCTIEERVALRQIAKHGWANYLQEPALTHLFQRALVLHDRRFEVRDLSFSHSNPRSFSDEHFVIPDESGSADALSILRIVLVLGGVAFLVALAYVWGAQMVAYVAAGASAVTTATRAFAKSKGRGSMDNMQV